MLLVVLVWLVALGPACVASWKGSWLLLDLLLLPGDRLLSGIVSLALGLVIGFPLVFLHHPLTSASANHRLLSAVHHFVGLEVHVLLWRGSWTLLDLGLGVGSVWSTVTGAVTAVVMAGAGCLPTVCAVPPVPHRRGAEDQADTAPTAARAVVHALLTLLPVLAGCVLVWHGVWGVLDGWAPPDAPIWLTVTVLAAGSLAVAVLCVLPHRLGWVAGANPDFNRPYCLLRRLREDLLAALMTVASVSYWKGLFDLMGRLSVPEYPWLPGTALMLVGFAVMAVTEHSAQSYTVGRVVWSDGHLRWLQALGDDVDEAVQSLIAKDNDSDVLRASEKR